MTPTPEPLDPHNQDSENQPAATHRSAAGDHLGAAPPADSAPQPSLVAAPPLKQRKPWQFLLLNVSLALFCLEVGAFLIVFPQQDSWNLNYFSGLSPWIQDIWDAAYFRWAVSGVGVLNIYVAFLQIRNLFRY